MSLRQVLLVYLGSGAASGYDIVKGFQKTYGHLWNATWQQVYRDLNKLRVDGLVEFFHVDLGQFQRQPRLAAGGGTGYQNGPSARAVE